MTIPGDDLCLSLDFVSSIDYQIHTGIEKDLSKRNRDVFAVADGITNFDYDIYDRFRWIRSQDSVGNMVIQKIQLDAIDYCFRYCHLIENLVSNGQIVKQGGKIGVYADVGYSFGAHLHVVRAFCG